tara:strand:+ start:13293 stop:15467 length:2175 start_codon:yes stop_codon:yes gene_type:complete
MQRNILFLNLPLTLSTLVGVFVGSFSRDVKISGLAAAITSSTIIFANLKSERWNIFQSKNYLLISKIVFILSILCCYFFSYKISFIEKLLPVIFFGIGYLLTNFLYGKIFSEKLFNINACLSLIILYGLSIGHTFAGSYLKELASYSVMFVGGVFSNIFYISSDKKYELNFEKSFFLRTIWKILSLTFFSFLIISVIRTDFLDWVHGSLFHWFYFVGPLSEYQAGGGLETLNQYSQGALLLASKFSESPWYAFYSFQVFIYIFTISSFSLIIFNKNKKVKILFACLGFLLLFSDPSSVGPQSFPSSGLLRFFPLVVWSIYFSIQSISLSNKIYLKNIQIIIKKIIFLIGLLVSFLWSGEMFICTLIASTIVLTYRYGKIILDYQKNFFSKFINKKNKKFFLQFLVISLLAGLFILFVNQKIGIEKNTLLRLLSYPFSYINKNYGWYEPGAWITISPLYTLLGFCSIVIFTNKSLIQKIAFIACSGLVLGYVSYRPVSNNITAVLPTSLILITSFFSQEIIFKIPGKYEASNISDLIKPLRSIILSVAGISAILQFSNFERINQIFSISLGKSRGEFQYMGGNELIRMPDCDFGDQTLSNLIQDKNLLKDIRESKVGISFIGYNSNYLFELGDCHKYKGKRYHPLVFQPSQLYFPPLDKSVSSLAIRNMLNKRAFNKILFISLIEDKNSKTNRKYFYEMLPKNWIQTDNFLIGNELEAFLWTENQ